MTADVAKAREEFIAAMDRAGERGRCEHCGGPKLEWQVFCGAACCAEYEADARPGRGD